MHPPVEFKTGYRGIMLLHRNKDGEKGNAQFEAHCNTEIKKDDLIYVC